MPDLTPPFLTEARFDQLTEISRAALEHLITTGDLPDGADPIDAEAVKLELEALLRDHKVALMNGTVGFLSGLAKKAAFGDDEPVETFEARIQDLEPEQLAELMNLEADALETARREIIDGRRELVAAVMATGAVLLRGALSSGLTALVGAAGG